MASWSGDGASVIGIFASKALDIALFQVERDFADTATEIMDGTPIGLGPKGDGIGAGVLRANWQIGRRVTAKVLRSGNKKKGRAYADNRITRRFSRKKDSSIWMFNNAPYVGVVEYGGYPIPVKKGTWNARKQAFEIRSQGGYSKQAPTGMVRIPVANWRRRNRVKLR